MSIDSESPPPSAWLPECLAPLREELVRSIKEGLSLQHLLVWAVGKKHKKLEDRPPPPPGVLEDDDWNIVDVLEEDARSAFFRHYYTSDKQDGLAALNRFRELAGRIQATISLAPGWCVGRPPTEPDDWFIRGFEAEAWMRIVHRCNRSRLELAQLVRVR